MRRFMNAVSVLKKTAPMLAINLHYWEETMEVLNHSDVLGPYIRKGIKGIGIPDYKETLDIYKAGSILELKLRVSGLHSARELGKRVKVYGPREPIRASEGRGTCQRIVDVHSSRGVSHVFSSVHLQGPYAHLLDCPCVHGQSRRQSHTAQWV